MSVIKQNLKNFQLIKPYKIKFEIILYQVISIVLVHIMVTYDSNYARISTIFFMLFLAISYYIAQKNRLLNFFYISLVIYLFCSGYTYFSWFKIYSIWLVYLAYAAWFITFGFGFLSEKIIYTKFGIPGGFSIGWMIIYFILEISGLGAFLIQLVFFLPAFSPLVYFIKSYGLTFLFMYSSFIVAYFLIMKRRKVIFSILFFTLLLIHFLMYIYSSNINIEKNAKSITKVALIQGNFPQNWAWRKNNVNKIMDIYIGETKKAYEKKPFEMVFWPEYAIPGDPFTNQKLRNKMSNLAKELNIYIVSGCSPWVFNEKGKENYNSSILVDSNGEIMGRYDSVAPLPYDIDVKKGNKKKIFTVKDFKIGITMCYEEFNYALNNYYFKNNVDCLVVLANHALFQDEKGLYQSSRLINLRAAENKLFAIRVTNTGITKVVSSRGYDIIKATIKKKTYLITDIYRK